MEIMENYADLLRKIDILEAQIEILETEIEYWWWTDKGMGKGFSKYRLDISSQKTDEKLEKLDELRKMLEFYKEIKTEIDEHINSLEGLEYKVAYKRFVENKTYQEIAEELGYTYGYIRQVASRTNKQRTETLTKS